MMRPVLVTHMHGRPVINGRTGDRIGRVSQVTLDRALRRLTGFRLRCGGLLDRRWRVAALQDVTDVSMDAVVLPDEIALREDEPGASSGRVGLSHLSVHRESGELLGHVADVLVDLSSGDVLGLLVTPGRRRLLHGSPKPAMEIPIARVCEAASTRLIVDGEAAATLRSES